MAAAHKVGGVARDAAQPKPWDGAGTDPDYGQYIFQDSNLADYAGNIIVRTTTFALFQ